MKISLVGPVYPYRGGIAHFTSLLSIALLKAGQEIQVVSFKRMYPRILYPGKSDRDPSSDNLQIEANEWLDAINPFSWWSTYKKISSWTPDAVIIQWWVPFLSPALGSLAVQLHNRGIPIYYIVHNVLPHEPLPLAAPLARWALGPANGFWVQTYREADRLRKLLPKACVNIYPHPVYDVFRGQPVDFESARLALNLLEKEVVLLFFGIVRYYKGLDILIEALAHLKKQGKVYRLIIAGEFWEDPNKYLQLARQLGVVDQIKIENRYIPNEELNIFFVASNIVVAPYRSGTQSGVVRMALGFNKPIVLSDAIGEDVLNIPGICTFPSGNVQKLAEAIIQALDQNIIPSQDNLPSWDGLAANIITHISHLKLPPNNIFEPEGRVR